MAASRKTRPALEKDDQKIGLLANGASGGWEIAIDASLSGTDRWFAQIEGPSISFAFRISAPEVVGKMLRFLQPSRLDHAKKPGSLVLGKDQRTTLRLVRDDEYSDRYFFVVGPLDRPLVRFTIGGAEVMKIVDALRQVEKDLAAE